MKSAGDDFSALSGIQSQNAHIMDIDPDIKNPVDLGICPVERRHRLLESAIPLRPGHRDALPEDEVEGNGDGMLAI